MQDYHTEKKIERKQAPTKWEKITISINFLSGIVIASLAVFIAQKSFQLQMQSSKVQIKISEDQLDAAKMQTLATFLPIIRDPKSKEEKDYAISKIEHFMNPDEVTRLYRVYPDPAFKPSVNKHFSSEEPTERSKPVRNPAVRDSGWVYLGEFNGSSWETEFFDIGRNREPETLLGDNIKKMPSKTVFIRDGPPDSWGKMSPIIGTLNDDLTVEVIEVESWFTTGFIWARVEYNQ